MAVRSEVMLSDLSPDMRWDAEHYKPEYLKQEMAMRARKTVRLQDVASVSDGNHIGIAEEFCDEGVRYLRGKDLSDFFISDADPIYIPEKFYNVLKRSHMLPGDVLVGIIGTIGSIGLVTERHGKLTGNCKLAIVRANSIPAEFIAAYLASRVGQNEIQRRVRGAVQMGLILPDLKDIPIVVPSDKLRDAVVEAVRGSQAARQNANRLMTAAETLLLTSIGLDHIDLAPSRSYSRPFSDLLAASRYGSEYFMPCKQRALDALAALPHKPLNKHASNIRELWDPKSANASEMVRNFDLGDALEPFLDDTQNPIPACEVGSTKKKFQRGDVVISRLRSYLKEIAVVRTVDSKPCVGSSEFIVLRPTGKGLSAEALLVYLRCPLIQTVLKWSQDGSNHPRFNEDDLMVLPVPDRLMEVSKEIEAQVHAAITARQEAARLLAEAKALVESAVKGEK